MRVLRHGAKGEDVRLLQGRLRAWGWALPKYGADGHFGDETQAAVVEFQLSQGLAGDGIVGPMTWPRVLSDAPRPGNMGRALDALASYVGKEQAQALVNDPRYTAAAVMLAVTHLGIREQPDGSNAGPQLSPIFAVHKIWGLGTAPGPHPWCATFCSWAIRTAFLSEPAILPGPYVGAWRFEWWAKEDAPQRWHSEPELGDIWVQGRQGSGSDTASAAGRVPPPVDVQPQRYFPGHCGLVIAADDRFVYGIAGNVNNAVSFQTVPRDRIRGFVRWS